MLFRSLSFVLIVCAACMTASKTAQTNKISEENKDLVALSYLIRDYMRETKNVNFTLSDIFKFDTLSKVTQNFSSLEVANWSNVWRGGYAVYFKFSKNRNKDSVELKDTEKIPWKMTLQENIGKSEAQLAANYDGEIHFYYPERFYHIVEIIVKK